MNVVIIDGQGGGVGRGLAEQMKKNCPEQRLTVLGTNAMATAAMLRAGADQGATGENAVIVACRDADLILGPMGIVLADAMLGEITPQMASAIGQSKAMKILVPIKKCKVQVAGTPEAPLAFYIQEAAQKAAQLIKGSEAPA